MAHTAVSGTFELRVSPEFSCVISTGARWHDACALAWAFRFGDSARPVSATTVPSKPQETSMLYAAPGTPGAKLTFKPQYDNFIGGKFVPPLKGQYFDVITPINGKPFTRAARSGAEDIELALDAAHAAADAWGRTAAAERANVLLRIADRIEQNLELLAYAETVDNGKPIRQTLN